MQGSQQRPVGFLDALYFSIVTETTLGANDIQCTGASRLLVCIQVFVGLALGGIVVAKITSIQGRELRLLAHRAAGDWIETCRMPNGSLLFTFITIYLSEDTIRYDGENYDVDGHPVGFFHSKLFEVDQSILGFRYSNREGSMAYFTEGTATVRFINGPMGKRKRILWSHYQGAARDFAMKEVISYEGFRATTAESNAFRGLDYGRRTEIIQQYLSRLPKLREPKPLNSAAGNTPV